MTIGYIREVVTLILEVENLTIKFGELAACNDVSFSVEKGEIFGIAGPNGAGKTTLFNCITGFYKNEGKVTFDGADITNLAPDKVCHMGITRTFQIPTVFQSMNMIENIYVGAHFGKGKEDSEKAIEKILTLLNLRGKEKYESDSLSLYDKKLTMLATALATQPKLLLLDEPVGGLSPAEIADFMELVHRIRDELSLSIIIIEHLMKVLTGLSERLMILDNGKIIKIGDPVEVTNDKRVIEVYLGEVEAHA